MKDSGFSLVEVLIAMLLLSLGLLAIAPMFVTATRQNSADAETARVGALAVHRLEQIRALPFDDLDPGGSLTANQSVGGVPYFDTSTPGFVVRWEIVGGATPLGGRSIAVRATSLAPGPGPPREATLRTLRVGD